MSIMFDEICTNKEILPKYTHTHTHTHSILRVEPHGRLVTQQNSRSEDDNIYTHPPWGLSILEREFSAAARIMQISSKELSTLGIR